MPVEIRPATLEQASQFRTNLGRVFAWEPPAEREQSFIRLWEPDRAFCAFDGAEMVATSGAFSLNMTVPGGKVRAGGTTMVSVLPTYRRQGILGKMLRAHLADVSDHSEPIAALWASDSAIYGRFGYGLASLHYELNIDPRHAAFHRLSPEPSPIELIDSATARHRLPPIYDKVAAQRAGFIDRSETWWEERWFSDPASQRDGYSSLRFAVAADDSGYMIYRQKIKWEEGHGQGELDVLDLMANTPGGWAGLWKLALSHDLTSSVSANLRPVDDPIFELLAGRRRAMGRVSDALWVRIQDLPAALGARSYQIDGKLTIAVVDRFMEKSSVVELVSSQGEVECRDSEDPPDLTLDLEDLSASYMGYARFRNLAALGRVAGSEEAVTKADLMFGWSPQPWCPEIF